MLTSSECQESLSALSITCYSWNRWSCSALSGSSLMVFEWHTSNQVNRQNIVAKQKSSQSPRVTQLKLNCESGITLYIKRKRKRKKKKNNLALSLFCFCFFPFCLIYGLVWEIRHCRCFIFSNSCKLPGKKRKQTEEKKNLKGLCICLIHLEFF